MDIVLLLVIAGLVGAVAQAIVGYSHGGCLASIGFGFVGALVGVWLSRLFGIPDIFAVRLGTVKIPIVWSLVGAVLFVGVLVLMHRTYYRRRLI